MKQILLATAVAVIIAAPVWADEAADQKAAKEVIERAVKAAKWDKFPSDLKMTWKDKGTMSVSEMKLQYSSDWAFAAPDKYRFVAKLSFMNQSLEITVVTNGGKAWEAARELVREPREEKLAYITGQVYQMYVSTLNPLLNDAEFKLKPLPDKDVDGNAATGVEVTRKGKPTVKMYFDKNSGLHVKNEIKVRDEFQDWKEVLDESYFSGWKDTGEFKVYSKLKIVRDGKPMFESELSDQKRPEKLDAKLFEKPAGK